MKTKEVKLEIKEVGFEPVYKNLDKIQNKAEGVVNSYAEISEAFKSVLTPASTSLKTLDQVMIASVKHIIPNMEKINKLNRKMAKEDLETNALKMKNNEAEIAGLEKKKTATTKLYEYYDKEEKKILERGKKRQKEQLRDIDNLIIAYKRAGKDTTKEEAERAEFIKNSDNAILNAIKENIKKRKEAVTAATKETVNSMKQMYEEQKALIIEAGELEKQKAQATFDAAKEQAATDEERIALEKAKAERIEAIDKDMNNKLAENSKTQLTATTAFVDDAIKEITDKVAENKKNSNGITDIALTKENIAAAKEQLDEHKKTLEAARNADTLHYAALETLYKDDAGRLKQVQEEKKNAMETHASNIAKVEKAITETSKKENGLRKQQIKEYVDVAAKATKKASDIVTKNFDEGLKYLQDGLNFLGIEFDAAKYDEKINENNKKQNEYAENAKKNIEELNYLKQRQSENSASLTQEEINRMGELDKKINDDFKNKKKLEKEEEELKKKKDKADKIRKKAELSRDIIVTTANVAAAVAKALTAGPFIGQVQAGIQAAMGAIQIAKMTKQLAKLEDGGLLKGKRHSQGGMRIEGTNIEVEGGEYVVNRESTSKNLGLVRYINSQRKELTPTDLNSFFAKASQGYEIPFGRQFEAGGTMSAPIIQNHQTVDNEDLLKAIKSINMKVAVTDIIRVQDEMRQVDTWSGI